MRWATLRMRAARTACVAETNVSDANHGWQYSLSSKPEQTAASTSFCKHQQQQQHTAPLTEFDTVHCHQPSVVEDPRSNRLFPTHEVRGFLTGS